MLAEMGEERVFGVAAVQKNRPPFRGGLAPFGPPSRAVPTRKTISWCDVIAIPPAIPSPANVAITFQRWKRSMRNPNSRFTKIASANPALIRYEAPT